MNIAQPPIALTNLAPVGIEDAEVFLAAAERARVKAWLYYFPLMYFHGQFRAHMLRWERYADSILVYQIRRKQGRSRLDLYLPPFPFDPAAGSCAAADAGLQRRPVEPDRLGAGE